MSDEEDGGQEVRRAWAAHGREQALRMAAEERVRALEAEIASKDRLLEEALEWGRQYAADLGMPRHGPAWFHRATTALASDSGKPLLEERELHCPGCDGDHKP